MSRTENNPATEAKTASTTQKKLRKTKETGQAKQKPGLPGEQEKPRQRQPAKTALSGESFIKRTLSPFPLKKRTSEPETRREETGAIAETGQPEEIMVSISDLKLSPAVKKRMAEAQQETNLEFKKGLPGVRYLKIQPKYRAVETLLPSGVRYKYVPELRLEGIWFEELGFSPEKYASVTSFPGLVIIRAME